MLHQTNYRHIEKYFTSHKQCLFGLLFAGNSKRNHTDRSILQVLLLFLKRKDSQTFKSLATFLAKTLLPSVYFIVTTCFDKCFLLYVITGRHSFLYVYSLQLPEVLFNHHALAVFEISILKVRILSFTSKIIPKFQNEPLSYRPNYYFLTTFIF